MTAVEIISPRSGREIDPSTNSPVYYSLRTGDIALLHDDFAVKLITTGEARKVDSTEARMAKTVVQIATEPRIDFRDRTAGGRIAGDKGGKHFERRPAADDSELTDGQLRKMTVKGLRSIARGRGIEIAKGTTKNDLIGLILEAVPRAA